MLLLTWNGESVSISQLQASIALSSWAGSSTHNDGGVDVGVTVVVIARTIKA